MFENIFGNNSIKNILKQSIDSNKVSHSYLMIGVSGIGKKNGYSELVLKIGFAGDFRGFYKE